jgi:hypothetical protein
MSSFHFPSAGIGMLETSVEQDPVWDGVTELYKITVTVRI